MRIALCWSAPSRLVDISVRHEHYIRGFNALGHDAVTVCESAAADGYTKPVITASANELCDVAFWRRIGASLVLMITWLSRSAELNAARRAGAKTIAIADSDGQVGIRSHTRHQLHRSLMQHHNWLDRIRASKYFVQRYLWGASAESGVIVASVNASDRVLLNTQAAAGNLSRFLKSAGRQDLCERLVVSAYPVDEGFLRKPVNANKSVQLVAVGRWDSMQKDGRLLAKGLRAFYESGGLARSMIFGPGGREHFDAISHQFPLVAYRGVQLPDVIAAAMRESQILLLTSRWESGPIVAFEALTQGSTMVSTRIPNMVDLCGRNEFGRIATRRSAAAFAEAIHQELEAWSNRTRNPHQIAARWRPVFDATNSCKQMLELVAL